MCNISVRVWVAAVTFVACAVPQMTGTWQGAERQEFVISLETNGECTLLIGHVGFRCRYIRTGNAISIVDEFKQADLSGVKSRSNSHIKRLRTQCS
jgi:hypothetical protein